MATWNTAFQNSPGPNADASEGDDRIRELKSAIYERLVKEMVMNTSSGLAAEDGWMRSGSGKIYYGGTAPTTRPDGVTALSSADYGRLWVDSDDMTIKVYTSSGWVDVTVAEALTALEADHATDCDTIKGVPLSSIGGLPSHIVTLTSGSGNWTVPAGVYRLKVKCVGGGGGGAGSNYDATTGKRNGGGGGAGTDIGSVIPTILSVSPGQSIAYSVGAGGAGGSAGGGDGSAGGNTTFGSVLGVGAPGGGILGNSAWVNRASNNMALQAGSPAGLGARGGSYNYDIYLGGSGGGAGGSGGTLGDGYPGGYGGGGGGGSIKSNATTESAGGSGGSGIIIIEY